MEKFSITVLLLFVVLGNIHAQSISGRVIDAKKGEFLSFANVVLFDSQTKQVINGCCADVDGLFKIDKINSGIYFIKVSCIGYADSVYANVKVKKKKDTAVMFELTPKKEKLFRLLKSNEEYGEVRQ